MSREFELTMIDRLLTTTRSVRQRGDMRTATAWQEPSHLLRQPQSSSRKVSADLATQERVMASVESLIERLGEVPIHIVPCVVGRNDGTDSDCDRRLKRPSSR